MEHFPLLAGILIGFVIAAPVGPVGILCIRRALADGHVAAFTAGLGAAVADTVYGAVAALGISAVSHWLTEHQTVLRLIGAAFLLVLGVHTWRNRLKLEDAPTTGLGLLRDFVSTFLITLTNPGTILAFLGIFAAIGGASLEGFNAYMLILGVFLGSALWWFTLSALADAARSRISQDWLNRLNKGSALLLIVFGIGLVVSLGFDGS